MLAEKDVDAPQDVAARHAAEAGGDAAETAPRRRAPGGVPHAVRRIARDAAARHGMTPGAFLAQAILAYAAQLGDGAAPAGEASPGALDDALRRCEHRIALLERRLRALETPARAEGFGVHKWLENLVERPWLRSRDY